MSHHDELLQKKKCRVVDVERTMRVDVSRQNQENPGRDCLLTGRLLPHLAICNEASLISDGNPQVEYHILGIAKDQRTSIKQPNPTCVLECHRPIISRYCRHDDPIPLLRKILRNVHDKVAYQVKKNSIKVKCPYEVVEYVRG
uniref:AAA_11 domain-containing protein n=1 Tax=Steinernema glaseri TaxID=37863 RepID=A0A1I7Y9T6_9BILA